MRVEKPRVLLFAYDGTGLGHLMRLVKIASGLKNDFLPLIVTGHSAINEIVQDGIEFIRLPNFESDFFKKTTDEKPDTINIKKFRISSLWHIIKTFKPNVLITDFLPTGKKSELTELVMNYNCIKYLVLRGEIGSSKLIENVVFTQQNNALLLKYFNRILIACDKKVTNLNNIEAIPIEIKNMFKYVGFVTFKVDSDTVTKIRNIRLNNSAKKWIVCSAGGGKLGEELIKKCLSLTNDKRFSDYHIDIVQGNYSSLPWENIPYKTIQFDNIRISKDLSNLYLLHAAADYVICSGGYNSLIESIQGNPKFIFSYSVQTESNEQTQNIKKFQSIFPIHEIDKINDLEKVFLRYASDDIQVVNYDIDFDGIENIVKIIKMDTRNAANI